MSFYFSPAKRVRMVQMTGDGREHNTSGIYQWYLAVIVQWYTARYHCSFTDFPLLHHFFSSQEVFSSENAVVHFPTTVPHLNISDIPFIHCNRSGYAVVSSSDNAVVHCHSSVPHLNISDIPFNHCNRSGYAVVSSSDNAVVHCHSSVPHLNISDIPLDHCFYTGLPLISHCMSTASFLPLLPPRSSI